MTLKISGDKFVIIRKESKSVDLNLNQIQPIDINQINNQSYGVDLIEIDEIIQQEIYLINS